MQECKNARMQENDSQKRVNSCQAKAVFCGRDESFLKLLQK
jgi:hypothetical protein